MNCGTTVACCEDHTGLLVSGLQRVSGLQPADLSGFGINSCVAQSFLVCPTSSFPGASCIHHVVTGEDGVNEIVFSFLKRS